MISVRLHGGLGNTLFQYALGKALATRGKQVVYEKYGFTDGDGSTHHRTRPVYGLDGFHTTVPLGPRQSPEVNDWRMRYDPTVWDLDSADLYGHWQSDKYLVGIEDELRQDLVPVALPPQVEELGLICSKGYSHTTAVHVRRGDYTDPEGLDYHGVLSERYYWEAANRIVDKDTFAHFYVFSDDPVWCREHFPSMNHVSTGNRHWDLWLMSQCRHIILANSSFSWWSAFLGDWRKDRIVIAPGRWVKTDVLDMADIYREHWTRIWDDSFFE